MIEEEKMNDKKICFIMCVNNERYVEEQMRYLNQLKVPQGYEIDVLTIWEAQSMAAGYNEGMKNTDAKYKIYMHQDVFIVNSNFISEILKVFADQEVGMLGVIGSPNLPQNAIMWNGGRIGRVYANLLYHAGEGTSRTDFEELYREVEALDGLLIATQYDLPWREDIFTGWDFYDISQSQEFLRKGYKVVVPKQEEPWCIHDDDILNLIHYYDYRKKFIEEYMK